jgi:hypothetical protein
VNKADVALELSLAHAFSVRRLGSVRASEAAIDRLARNMIERHGEQAALRAVERLNDHIDNGDWNGRDTWAAVVQAIHELQNVGPFSPFRSPTRRPAH